MKPESGATILGTRHACWRTLAILLVMMCVLPVMPLGAQTLAPAAAGIPAPSISLLNL